MSETKYHVGQELWRHDVNQDRRGGPKRVTVSKVGRKLVAVTEGPWSQTFRIDTGRANDAYQHQWLCTDEEHAEHMARSSAVSRLRMHGLSLNFGAEGRHTTATLAAIADLLDDAAAPQPEATRPGDEQGEVA